MEGLVGVGCLVILSAQVYNEVFECKERIYYLSHNYILFWKSFREWEYKSLLTDTVRGLMSGSTTWIPGNSEVLLQLLIANINFCDV